MYFFYYLPVGINAVLRRFPLMTWIYSALCVAVFVLARHLYDFIPFDPLNMIYVPAEANLLTAVAAVFLHFGYFHIIGNLFYLVLFGRYVEDRMGPVLFVLIFLSAGAIGNYLQGVFNIIVLEDPFIGIAGASGAMSGLLGAFTVRFLHNRVRVAYWVFMPLQAFTRGGRVELPVLLAIALWFLMQTARGLVQFGGAQAQVAYVSHISGFLWGVFVALLLGQYARGRVESWLAKGKGYLQTGQSYAAQGDFIRYVSECPDDADGHAFLARSLLLTGNKADAEKHYRKACEFMLDRGRCGDAEDLFAEALRGFPLLTLGAEAHLKLAFGLERNLKPKTALKAYENFERDYPRHKEAPFTLLRTGLLHLNTFEDAAAADADYQRLIEDYPDDQWVDFAREQVKLIGQETA